MMFVIFAILIIATTNAEDGHNEITSNAIVEKGSSSDKSIESREYVDKMAVLPVSGPPMKLRRSRYLRQAPRRRRRPPFEPRNMRRPGNNFPNLYGPRSRFKPNAPYRPAPPPKSRFRYRDNWRHKWPEHHQPPTYLEEDDMEQEPPYEEYDDVDEYRDDMWYSPKKYRDMYEDAMPTSSKYNEKRSPSRYLASYDYSRPKVRANYDPFEGMPTKDLVEWQDRNRYTRNYRNILDILTSGKKYEEEEQSMQIPMHRFKLANWNRLKPLEDDEYDFSGNTNNPKSRRFKTEKAVMRRPQVADDSRKYEGEISDISKYLAIMQATTAAAGLPSKETSQEAVYSAKYRDRDAEREVDKSKLKIDEDVSSSSSADTASILHDWKRTQKPNDFQSQFVPTVEKSNGIVDAATVARNQNYKDDHLSPSELIAYMSVDPGESVVGKEERYLHAMYPFSEKLSDHDILKATFPRKISPIIDQDLEITFDDRIGDWKH